MSKTLEQRLIRLGYQNPDLRSHIRPILDTLTGRRRTAGRRHKRADVIEDNYPIVEHSTEYTWFPEREFQELERDLRDIAQQQFSRFSGSEARKIYEEMTDRIFEIYQEYAPVAEAFWEGNMAPMEDIGADQRLQRYFTLEEMHEDDPGYFYRDLEMFIDRAYKDVQRFMASMFEDLYHKTKRSDDPYSESMANEYWEIAEHIRNRGF